jgi:hypothetical protein
VAGAARGLKVPAIARWTIRAHPQFDDRRGCIVMRGLDPRIHRKTKSIRLNGMTSPCPGRSAAHADKFTQSAQESDALQTRDRSTHRPFRTPPSRRSRISGAPLRSAIKLAQIA